MAIADYELYERLKPKLGEAETRALLERFDRFERELPERIRREAATKADLQELKEELKADFQELRGEFLKFKIEILERIHQLEQQMEQRFHTLEQRFHALEQQMEQRFHTLEQQMEQRFHALEQRSDRLLYIVVILFLIFNSDKVIGLVQALMRLTGR